MDRMEDRFVLAPLAGYTDKAFREMATRMGADITVSEMVSAEGLARDGEKTKELLERFDGEERIIIQLFGPDEDPVERCLPALLSYKPTQVDFNCGCPVPKVVKTGAGSALMRTPEKITRIVQVLKEGTGLPVSVKFRLGWDSDSINYLQFAEAAAKGGADVLTLHARTRAQGYEGKADRNAFRLLSKEYEGSGIKVYGSGDVFSPEDAKILMEECGLYGVMFARGAIGNPFIFRETKEYWTTGSYALPSTRERIEAALTHYSLMEKYYGEKAAGHEMRKHAMAYIKGIKGASKAKAAIGKAYFREEYREALESLLEG